MSENNSKKQILKAEHLSKTYKMGDKSLNVLTDVNLNLYEGEIVSILGISGSGKSTLLSILGTLDKPNEGSLVIDGDNVTTMPEVELAKMRNSKIGFVFQFHYLLPEFSALENVAMPGLIQKKSKKEIYNKAESLLKEVNLAERMDHKPNELSGGEQQRVAVARALINDPLIVLADEPTGNLDRFNGESLYELMLDLSKSGGKSFLVVTHNEVIANKTDKQYTLAEGKLQ